MEKKRFVGKISDQVVYLYRIDKRKAKAFFETGKTVYLVQINLDPFNQEMDPMAIGLDSGKSFESLSDQFKEYFCLNSYTGYFPGYYVNLFESSLKPIKL